MPIIDMEKHSFDLFLEMIGTAVLSCADKNLVARCNMTVYATEDGLYQVNVTTISKKRFAENKKPTRLFAEFSPTSVYVRITNGDASDAAEIFRLRVSRTQLSEGENKFDAELFFPEVDFAEYHECFPVIMHGRDLFDWANAREEERRARCQSTN